MILYSSMLTHSLKISLSIVYFQIMTTLGSIIKKKAGTWNRDEAWRDNGILSENWSGWRDFGNRYRPFRAPTYADKGFVTLLIERVYRVYSVWQYMHVCFTSCMYRVSPKKWHYRNYLIVLKPLLNARDYTPGNLMNLYLHLSILKRFRFVQIF
jgi:hypothetical protein